MRFGKSLPLTYTVFTLMCVLFGALITRSSMRERFTRDALAEVDADLRAVAATAASFLDPLRLEAIREADDPYLAELRASFRRLDADFSLDWLGLYRRAGDGFVNVVDGQEPGQGLDYGQPVASVPPELRAAWDRGDSAGVALPDNPYDVRWLRRFHPVKRADGAVVGMVDATRRAELATVEIPDFARRILFTSLALVLWPLLMGFVLAIMVTRPLRELREALGALTAGGRVPALRLNERTKCEEVEEVVAAFNAMTAALGKRTPEKPGQDPGPPGASAG